MWRACNRRVRWLIQRFPDGPQSGSHNNANDSTSPPTIPDGGFSPVSVLTLAFRCRPFQNASRLKCWRTCTPPTLVCPQLRPYFESRCSLGTVSEPPPWDRQVPRAPLPHAGVTAMREASRASSKGVTPSSSLIQAHAPNLCPPLASGHGLVRPVFADCRQPLLGTGPSRRYLCRSFPACLDPYSGCPRGARTRFFPQDIGLPRVRTGSALRHPPTATSVGTQFRSCSHSLMFRPTSLLATPIAPTLMPHSIGQPWLLHPRLLRFVTSPYSGYANRPQPGNWRYGDSHLAKSAALSAAPPTFAMTRAPRRAAALTSAGVDRAVMRHLSPRVRSTT